MYRILVFSARHTMIEPLCEVSSLEEALQYDTTRYHVFGIDFVDSEGNAHLIKAGGFNG